jgi:hypothetical protein
MPEGGARFLMEDADVPVAFTPGRDGRMQAMRVWFQADEPVAMRRMK